MIRTYFEKTQIIIYYNFCIYQYVIYTRSYNIYEVDIKILFLSLQHNNL